MYRYVFDTVALVRILDGNATPRVKEVYDKAEKGKAEIIVPTMVLAEIIWILRKRRNYDLIHEIIADLKRQQNTLIVPFSSDIVEEMAKLKRTHELHDEIIALMAFVYGVNKVCTKDDDLVKIKNLVKIW